MQAVRKSSPTSATLQAAYQGKLQHGWQPDAAQSVAIAQLQALAEALNSNSSTPPKGLWLYSPPGRGKSQLLDMFMASLPMPNKRRVHFHAFMTELHQRMAAMPAPPLHARKKPDYVAQIAAEIHAEATVLGFDEFYLTNLPDALFLGRLMQALFKLGTVVVATSNWPLPDLFQGGLNRDSFLPLLKLLQAHLTPIDLSGGPDYRQQRPLGGPSHYIQTHGRQSAEPQLAALFAEYTNGPNVKPLPFLHSKRQSGSAIWLTFAECCDQPLGRQEYHQLCQSFQTVVIEGIPALTPAEANSALRLATLVDILYEKRRRLIISAAVPPAQICPDGPAAQVFQRTASRLVEMTHSFSEVYEIKNKSGNAKK
jgi:cell division protein ZapE